VQPARLRDWVRGADRRCSPPQGGHKEEGGSSVVHSLFLLRKRPATHWKLGGSRFFRASSAEDDRLPPNFPKA